jgi:hypothetical protein
LAVATRFGASVVSVAPGTLVAPPVGVVPPPVGVVPPPGVVAPVLVLSLPFPLPLDPLLLDPLLLDPLLFELLEPLLFELLDPLLLDPDELPLEFDPPPDWASSRPPVRAQ